LSENRTEERNAQQITSNPIFVAETLRNSLSGKEEEKGKNSEERVSPFWRIFGGTLLSITALVIMTVCQHFNSTLNEQRDQIARFNDEIRKDMMHSNEDLRKDLSRLSESYGDLVKKEEMSSRFKSVWDGIKDLQSMNTVVTGLKERAILRDQQFKEQGERQELIKELQQLRERLANLEGKQASTGSVRTAEHRDNK
jgi:heme exporter protein D